MPNASADKRVIVTEYDATWPDRFERIRSEIAAMVGDLAIAIEHVGSTSVPGLAAKPIIDLDIVVAPDNRQAAIMRLSEGGYVHRGELGVHGRDAFFAPPHPFEHHLYLCPAGSLGLRNHLAVRDFLRENLDVAQQYGQLKLALAVKFSHDIEGYVDAKTDFLLDILRQSDVGTDELSTIEDSNRIKP